MFKKLLELEKRLFSAPYRWLVKKGIVTILVTSKKYTEQLKIFMRADTTNLLMRVPTFPSLLILTDLLGE